MKRIRLNRGLEKRVGSSGGYGLGVRGEGKGREITRQRAIGEKEAGKEWRWNKCREIFFSSFFFFLV